jgi:hypothetical protein
VFSCYRPVDDQAPIPPGQLEIPDAGWRRLLQLAHRAPSEAFEEYARHYLATSGQVYWSDTHQLSTYLDDYHVALDAEAGDGTAGSEMITETYVPRVALPAFMERAARALRTSGVPLIYGTVRLIERDEETFLAWAREPWACVIFNLHSEHTSPALERSAAAFRELIDVALAFGGSYYLTYHRYASRRQVAAAHPRLREFLEHKRRHDPQERLQSDWYRHHVALLAGRPPG